MKTQAIFEIVLYLSDNTHVTFRTDEWNERKVRTRLAAFGREIINEERKEVDI